MLAFAIASAALHGFAAQPAAQTKAGSPDPLPGVVGIDVVVTDSHGEAISGLSASDFQVLEGKKEQKIELCRMSSQMLAQRPPNRSGEFSNRSGTSLPAPTVLLLDLLNARFFTSAAGWAEAADALERLESPERMSLYLLTTRGELSPIESVDREDMDVALKRTSWTKTVRPTLESAAQSEQTLRFQYLDDPFLRFGIAYRTLSSLAGQMALLPGRKNLIWITHGVPLSLRDASGEPVDLSGRVKDLATLLTSAHIALYTVNQSSQGAAGGFDSSADLLRMLTRENGGRTFGSDYIEKAIHQARVDSRGTYTIAFDRPAGSEPGKYHKLQVKCLRRGVSVFAPQGYYDNSADSASTERVMRTLSSAVRAALDIPEIGLTATASRPAATQNELQVHVRVDARDVLSLSRDGHFHVQLVSLIAVYGEDGPMNGPVPSSMELNLSPAEFEKAMKNGIEINQKISVGTGAQRIRCIVMDRDLNSVGSVTLPVS